MHTMIYILIWIGCPLSLGVFSFILGRCSRRLPLIDDCMVPWVMHRGAISSGAKNEQHKRFTEVADRPYPMGRRLVDPAGAYAASALDGAVPRWPECKGPPNMFEPVSISSAQPSGTDAATLIARLDAELAQRYPGLDRDTFTLTPEQVRAGHGVFLIAIAGGEPVGCGALRRLDSATGEIKRMYVMPSARGARVGRRLLAKLEWYARQLGMYRLVLHTGLRQPEAIQLYINMGFARIAGFGKYTGSSTGICMAKTIIQ